MSENKQRSCARPAAVRTVVCMGQSYRSNAHDVFTGLESMILVSSFAYPLPLFACCIRLLHLCNED